jgi:hypothetical protein
MLGAGGLAAAASSAAAGVAALAAASSTGAPRALPLPRRRPAPRGPPPCRAGADESAAALGNLRRWLGLDPPPAAATGDAARRVDVDDAPARGAAALVRRLEASENATETSGGVPLGDWSAGGDPEWEDWAGAPGLDVDDGGDVAELREEVLARRRARGGKRSRVRDEYLRPIVDATGIFNRLALGEREAEERVFVEAITNQYESREALKYGAFLVAAPLALGFAASRLLAEPLWELAEGVDARAFALTDAQKVRGAESVHREEVRLRLEAAVGAAPALSERSVLAALRAEAARFEAEARAANKRALLNVVSDSTAGVAAFAVLLRDGSQRAILFRTIGRVFTGLSDTAKAFLIILVTDTLLGYHSEEGWTAALRLVSWHYGQEPNQGAQQLFVATVPVLMDAWLKYWVFVGLNKVDPAAAVTLRQMDRH